MASRTFGNRFRRDSREFKLRRGAFTATGPHARPLAFAGFWFVLATSAARIWYACSKRDWEVQRWAATTTSTKLGGLKATTAITAVGPHGLVTAAAATTTTLTFFLDCSCK